MYLKKCYENVDVSILMDLGGYQQREGLIASFSDSQFLHGPGEKLTTERDRRKFRRLNEDEKIVTRESKVGDKYLA